MNQQNILSFITKANLTGINAVNAQLQKQAQYLTALARQAAGASAAAAKLAQAWRQAGAALRMAQAGNISGPAFQNRNAKGQFAPGFNADAIKAALAQAASFGNRMRVLLSRSFTVPNVMAGLTGSVTASVAQIKQSFSGVGASILKALSPANVGAALKTSMASAASAMASLLTNAARAAGNAIRTLIGGALNTVNRMAGMVAGTIRSIRGGFGNLGIAGALVSIGSFKAAFTVDKELAKINTIARETKPNLDLIAQGLEQIAFTTGTTFSDNAEAYYDLLSAGLGMKNGVVDIATSMQLMRDAANLAVGGIGSMKDSLDFMTTALNAFRGPLTAEFGEPLKASTKIADAFAKSVELGKTTVAELGPVFSTAAPLAAQLGVDWREMAAILAAMTQQGFDAGETFTALRSSLVGVQRDSKKLQAAALENARVMKVMKTYGAKTWLELIDKAGFQVFAETLRKYSEESGVPLIKLLGRIEGVQAILGTTGAQAENYRYILDQITTSSGNAAEQAALFNESLSAQLRLFGNALFAIGDALFRRRILDPIKAFVKWLNEAAGAVFQFVVENEKLFDILVPLFAVTTALAALTKGASAIENIFLRLGGPISGFAIGIGRIGMAIALVTGPIALVLASIATLNALISAGILPAQTFGKVLDALAMVGKSIGRAWDGLTKGIGEVVDALTNPKLSPDALYYRLNTIFSNMGKAIGPAIAAAGTYLRVAVQNLISSVEAFFGEGFDKRADAIGRAVLGALEGAWAWLAPRAAGALATALTFGAEVLTNLVEFGARIASAIGKAIIDALPKAAEFISGIPDAIDDSMSGGTLDTVLGQFEEWGRSFVGWFQENGPKIADGILKVFQAIGGVLVREVPKALGRVADILGGIWDAIVANKDEILAKAGEIVGGIVDAVGKLAAAIIPPLADAAGKMLDWITQDVIPFVARTVGGFIDSVVRALVPMGSDSGPVASAMTDVGSQLVKWIGDRVPGALKALLDWLVQVENWILTVLAPRIGAAMLAVGLGLLGKLLEGLVWAVRNPGQSIPLLAEVLYALLTAGVILKAVALAGAAVGAIYHGAIAVSKWALGLGGKMAVGLSRALITVGQDAALMAAPAIASFSAATIAAALTAALAAIAVVAWVAIQIRTRIQKQGDELVQQTKEFVKTATLEGIDNAIAAVRKQRYDLDLVFDFGLFSGPGRSSLDNVEQVLVEARGKFQTEAEKYPQVVKIPVTPVYSFTPPKNPGDVTDLRESLPTLKSGGPMFKLEIPVTAGLNWDVEDLASGLAAATRGVMTEVKNLDIQPTVDQFKTGVDEVVTSWNTLPDRLKSEADLLRDALKNPFDLKATTAQFEADRKLIIKAMESGDPKAIALARRLAASMTKMANDTNAAFIAAGKAPPYLIDPLTGAVTVAGQAGRDLTAGILNPLDALPGSLQAIGTRAVGNFVTSLNGAVPAAGAAGRRLYEGANDPLTTLPSRMGAIGRGAGGAFVTGLSTGVTTVKGVGGRIYEGATDPLTPTQARTGVLNTWGTNVASAWIRGVASTFEGATTVVNKAIKRALANTQGKSPPKAGPLKDIDQWGANIGRAWIDGVIIGIESGPQRIARAVAAVGAELNTAMTAQMAYATPEPMAYATAQEPIRREVTVRHLVRFDGQAPDGITEKGVAGYLQKGIDASGLMRNLKHATEVR